MKKSNTKNLLIVGGAMVLTAVIAAIAMTRKEEESYVILNEQTGMYENEEA